MQGGCWFCQVDASHPCSVCESCPVRTWNKLRKSLSDVRFRAIQRGGQHWTSAFRHFKAWIANWPASREASSEPRSEIGSLVDRGDDFSNNNVIVSTTKSLVGGFEVHESIGVNCYGRRGLAIFKSGHATLRIGLAADPPDTTQTSDVSMSDLPHTMPSVAGSTAGLVATPLITHVAMPLTALPLTLAKPFMTHSAMLLKARPLMAMQHTALPRTATPSTMTARTDQTGFSVTNNLNNSYENLDLVSLNLYSEKVNCVTALW